MKRTETTYLFGREYQKVIFYSEDECSPITRIEYYLFGKRYKVKVKQKEKERSLSMLPYKSSGPFSVTGYRYDDSSISIEYNHSSIYLYTYDSTGRTEVEKMKRLAEAQNGLGSYITSVVRNRFAKRLR